MPDEPQYKDGDGNPCTLDALCSKEPAWAANRIRVMRKELEDLRENARRLRASLKNHVAENKRLHAEIERRSVMVHRCGTTIETLEEEVEQLHAPPENTRLLLRRAQEWLGDDVVRHVPDFIEETRLREDIADELGECMTLGCTELQAPQDHLPAGSWHHRCAEHRPPGTEPPGEQHTEKATCRALLERHNPEVSLAQMRSNQEERDSANAECADMERQLDRVQEALDAANKVLSEHGLFGVLPNVGGPDEPEESDDG